MAAAHRSMLQDFPEDGDFDMFPISPDTSTATLRELLANDPGTPGATPYTSIFPGDIPVLLYDDAYARESFAFDSVALKVNSPIILPASEQIDNSQLGGSFERLTLMETLAELDSSFIRTSESLELISRFSTSSSFGQDVYPSSPDPSPGLNEGERLMILTHLANTDLRRNPIDNELYDDLKTYSHSQNHLSDRHDSQCGSPITSIGESTIVEPFTSQEKQQPLGSEMGVASQTFENTPKNEVSESSSWISSSNWNHQEYQDFVSQQRTPPRTLKTLKNRQPAGYSRVHEHHAPQNSEPKAVNKLLAHQSTQQMSRPPGSPQEDHSVSWMKPLAIQFLIDQEGFRDADPTFSFSGISQIRRYDQSNSSESIKLMAQFRPSSRQTFNFHYAPFEGPPILRRITVNNDDTLDYVSRQAHLPLRSNGVYIVQGYEMASSEQGTGSGASKLYWQFEYLVDNRRMDLTQPRRSLEGEKTLTPLMFSCSPNLIHPRQGKKINLIHIFKKSVAQKLVAEKLQPPGAYPISVRQEHITAEGEHSKNPHRRTQSQDTHNDDMQPRAVSDHIRLGRSQVSDASSSPSRHRRVSSAGQHQPSTTSPRYKPMKIANNFPSPVLDRHIIPPAQLVHLLDSPFKENAPISPELSPRLGAIPGSVRISRGFVGLSPRPKHAYKQKEKTI